VELTLLPLAAILLLLSGLSAPARSAVRQARDIALMREILGGDRQGSRFAAEAMHGPCRCLAQYGSSESPRGAEQATGRVLSRRVTTQPLFRTRFGHAQGAYLSTAPPRA
jgi:hypothetical protein